MSPGVQSRDDIPVWPRSKSLPASRSGVEQRNLIGSLDWIWATKHGFYRAADRPQDRPMLLSGVALAEANKALRDSGEDGILYAIEAQGLNLEGTELVVLSACETAQGQIDYAEGVSGLVRAFRTAGVRYVLG
jgi:CHAT domain-containing protein